MMVIKKIGRTECLLREIQILRRMDYHDNIINIYDIIPETNNNNMYIYLFNIFEKQYI